MKIKDDPNYPLETKQSLNGTKNISNNSQELNNTGQGSNVIGQGSDGEAHQNLRKLLAIPLDWRQESISIKPQEKKGSELVTYFKDEAAMSDRIYGRNENEVVEDETEADFLDKVKVGEETGVLPWEKKNLFSELQKVDIEHYYSL